MKAWLKPLTRVGAGIATLAVAAAASLGADLEPKEGMVYVEMQTNLGNAIIELNKEKAPVSVDNFMQYVEDEFYDGTIFHRVIDGFMVQGGGYTTDLEQKDTREPIANEWQNGLSNERGAIAMARLGNPRNAQGEFTPTPSATSQFFINVKDNPILDQARDGEGYAVFGKVVAGMDTIDRIRGVWTTKVGPLQDRPIEDVVIEQMREVEPENLSAAQDRLEAAEKQAQAKAQEMAEAPIKRLVEEAGGDYANVQTTDTGLKYVDITEGEGQTPEPTDRVSVHYTGWLVDGSKFDSSRDRGQPAVFGLNQVIRGWTQGVGGMKPGGRRVLIIPYDLAYGERGRPPQIPPKSTLVFDVELLSVQ